MNAKPVASIGTTYYGTLQDAVNAAEGDDIVVIENALDEGSDVTVSGASRTITFKNNTDSAVTFTVNGQEFTLTEGATDSFEFAGSSTGYTVIVNTTENGTVTASPASANKGDKVTLTVAPTEGYKLGALTAEDASGKTVSVTKVSDTQYTFVVPDSNATVSASFVEKNATPFTDIKTTDWWYVAVKYVYKNKLMAGTSTTTFVPNTKLNRAQAVQILYNLEGHPAVTGTAGFTDTDDAGKWAVNAITWAAGNNVVVGVGNGKFDPTANMTRKAFAQMMYNYAKYKGYDPERCWGIWIASPMLPR